MADAEMKQIVREIKTSLDKKLEETYHKGVEDGQKAAESRIADGDIREFFQDINMALDDFKEEILLDYELTDDAVPCWKAYRILKNGGDQIVERQKHIARKAAVLIECLNQFMDDIGIGQEIREDEQTEVHANRTRQ